MAPKTLIAALLVATLACVTPALAQKPDPAADKTRTLFVTVGGERLRFEIPEGMCFADSSNRQQAMLIDLIRRALAQKGDEHLLGLFMPCDSLANPGNPMAREGRVPSVGLILWPHKIEKAATLSSSDSYLNWRAASFREYTALNLPMWMLAADPLRQSGDTVKDPELATDIARTDHALMTTFSQYLSADGQPFDTVGAVGTLAVKGHPIEFALRLNGASGITTTDQAHDFMAQFMELQATLNR